MIGRPSQEHLENLCNGIKHDIHAEVNRLLNTMAIGIDTSLSTVMRVAIENVAECYQKGTDYNNLKRF